MTNNEGHGMTEPLPCPLCGKAPEIIEENAGWYGGDSKGHISDEDEKYMHDEGRLDDDGDIIDYPPYWIVSCHSEECGVAHVISTLYVLHGTRESAVGAWNDQVRAWRGEKKEEEE